ncbi:divergent protein kinase domain 1C-like [Branchiostoma floridae]|uniref:Divergent protein kinase domain 1C-like n=1 Tax=Branchiostoma floridae TaxID=7739 RepID=A0A9J7NA09_BRAFL|nr:divergent protein kinase domain 1C-like [Branchiostoma floridae]
MPRKRSWRRLCKFFVAGLLGFVLLAVLLVFTKYITHQCTEQEARDALRELCEEYARNRVTGNLCPDLCTAHSIIFQECLNYRKGKRVILAEWSTKKVILKSQYSHLHEYNSMIAKYTNEEGKVVTSQPDMATFLMVVKNPLRTMFQEDATYSTVRETVRKMWNMPWEHHETMSVAAMESLWALLQQEEYLLMQYFKGNKHFPKIYGSCGHFYVMEYTPTGDTLSPQLFSHKTVEGIFKSGTDWEDRAKLALSFLTFIEDLDTFYTEPLHLCDVKNKNYGVSEDLTIRAIDVDMAFFETKNAENSAGTGKLHEKRRL